MPKRSRYVTEYKANFKPINFEEAYCPPVLKPRVPMVTQSPVLREIALREQHQAQGDTEPKSPVATHRTYIVRKNSAHKASVTSDATSKEQHRKPNSTEKKEKWKDNRSLQYKAGLAQAIPRPGKENFLSEYQRQFNWKKPAAKESPILSADKIIFKSQEGMSPQAPNAEQKAKFSFKTEYQSQFIKHPWSQIKKEGKPHQPSDKSDKSDDSDDSGVNLSSPSPKKLPNHSNVPVRPFVYQTEYQSNFQPPSCFQYTKGAWVGTGPPHLHMQENQEKKNEDSPSKPYMSWFQQVLELRKKAHNYKLLARDGSQALQIFRRDEKGKQITPPPRDTDFESPVNDGDISLQPVEQAQTRSPREKIKEGTLEARERKESNYSELLPPQQTRSTSSLSEPEHSQRDERSLEDLSSSLTSISLSEELNLSPDGRPSTPELLNRRDTRRHHLDVTTSAKGGPHLVSPPLDFVSRGPFNVYESECSSRTSNEDQHSILSETAMEKRRALATETLKRARKQSKKVARRTGN